MAKSKLSDQEQVTQHIQKLDPSVATIIETLRQIILNTDPEISEQIKWNSPSFYYNGDMKPFDPKEYKRDIIVMNLHKGKILLVFPTGAKINDISGLLEGEYKDGRRIVNIKDLEHAKSKEKDLQNCITKWLGMVEK